ncbi:hypothetical protein V2J09_014160 [Rumex salicifolius]
MEDFFGSVRRSIVFRATSNGGGVGGAGDEAGFGGFVDKIGSSIRKSRIGLFSRSPSPLPLPALSHSPLKENMPPLPMPTDEPFTPPTTSAASKEDAPPFRWRKGELIGCGGFGRVYMGMNLDSGELLAVKQVCLPAKGVSNVKTQAHIKELEEEVKLLKNLSHPNIVRYLGTATDSEALNILLEFVPGGSIYSLLEKFGSFPESVLRIYTKQLLLGLEYLHSNGIMHRDIKGANILADNNGCIKLADFGASKKVVELATMTGAKSMKGTPFWMAPEVIRQTGHNFSADIWSVGCTVIEMATGRPPWSQQHPEACMAAALYHIGNAKSPPPIPDHLSATAKDFLLKCLQIEPSLRPSASELLQHPFVTGLYRESHPVFRPSAIESNGKQTLSSDHMNLNRGMRTVSGSQDICRLDSMSSCTQTGFRLDENADDDDMCQIDDDDDMCQIDDKVDFMVNSIEKPSPVSNLDDMNKSFNPMCEPDDEWPCKFNETTTNLEENESDSHSKGASGANRESCVNMDGDFTFPSEPLGDDDDEVTESKIREFLDEKALDLKRLQSPLYEFYNTLNSASATSFGAVETDNDTSNISSRTPSPHRVPSRRLSAAVYAMTASPVSRTKRALDNAPIEESLTEIEEGTFRSRNVAPSKEREVKVHCE